MKVTNKSGLDKELKRLCRKNSVMGANAVLFDAEGIIYSFNYGYINKERAIKSTNDSLYMIGSNTKMLTALSILLLADEGKLSLEDDIRKYIPELKFKADFDYEKITVGNLLMHRSGIVSDIFALILDNKRDYHDMIDELSGSYLASVPGEVFSYSNAGYTLLGIIIERVSGLSYTDFIKKAIAEPLGIGVSFLRNEKEREAFSSNVSLSYNKKGKAIEDSVATLIPAGSNTYMSINDFAKLGQMFLKKGGNVFEKEIIELMECLDVSEEIDKELQNAGYGLLHNQYDFGERVGKVLGHGGNTQCHHSVFNYIPNIGVGIIVMTNTEQSAVASRTLGLRVLEEYLEKRGLMEGKVQAKYTHLRGFDERYLGKFVTPLGLLEIRENKNGQPKAKLSKLNIKLALCNDGWMQCCPDGLIGIMPPISKAIKNLRLKLTDYCGKEVMLMEQTSDNNKTKGIIGCRYREISIPDSFKDACGDYEVVDKGLKNIVRKCSLKEKGGVLTLEIEAIGTKIIGCLSPTDDGTAFTLGIGRNSKQMVKIKKTEDASLLIYSKIVFRKKK